MNNEQVQKYWDEVVLKRIRGFAKLMGIEFDDNIARIACEAYEDGCNFTHMISADEFIGKDAYQLMHSILVERIIEAINELGKEEVEIKNGPYVAGVYAKSSIDGKEPYISGACVDLVRVNGESIVCEKRGKCLVMQNELTFADLLRIYRNIPYKEGW